MFPNIQIACSIISVDHLLEQKAKEATETPDEQQTEAFDSGLRWRCRHVEVFLLNVQTFVFFQNLRHRRGNPLISALMLRLVHMQKKNLKDQD